MPDALADLLARRLLALLPPGPPRSRTELDRLPAPVARYLTGVLDRRLARDAALPTSEWFDGAAAPVREAAAAWRAATHDMARFPAEDWAMAVQEASEAVLGFLVTPVEALTTHVFGDSGEPLDLDRVRARMAAFASYPYLREISEGYFARKGLDAIGRDDFEALLGSIDRRMASGFGADEWVALLEPLFTVAQAFSDTGIPTLLLRRFFVAKGSDDLARRLDAEAYDENALRITLAPLLPDAAPALHETGSATAEPADGVASPSDDRRAEAAPPPKHTAADVTETAPAADEAVHEDEPLWKRLARQSETGAPAPHRDAPAPDEEDDTPLWKRLAPTPDGTASTSASPTVAEDTPSAGDEPATAQVAEETVTRSTDALPSSGESLLALETRVLGPSGTARRTWYVEHLTAGSESDYRAVLEALDQAPSWTAASQVIARDIFRKHRVNIYADAAVAFTDAVEARYTS